MIKASRWLAFALIGFGLLFFIVVPQNILVEGEPRIRVARQVGILGPPAAPTSDTTAGGATPSPPTSTLPTSTSTTSTSTTSTTHETSSSSTSTSSSSSSTSSTSSTSDTSSSSQSNTQSTSPTTQQSQPTPTPESTSFVTTGSNGQATTVVVVTTPSPTQGSSTASSTASSSSSSSGSGGLGTGSIVGMSVAGGVALIGIIAFFVWKFSRKRFSDFDDNEAIKWPELNVHDSAGHALPTHATGGAGFGNDSEVSLGDRVPSRMGGYAPSVAASSTTELYPPNAGGDPYAVPPLPHLNPNQPYRDDPNNISSYYDPYRGPIPEALNDVAVSAPGQYGGEAIPMTQLAPGMRSRSPGPQAAYAMTSPQPSFSGRQSPGPQAVYDMGRASPQPPYGGRQSPGPQVALGYPDERTRTPGPM